MSEIEQYRLVKQRLVDRLSSYFESFAIYDIGSDGGLSNGPLKYLERMPNTIVVSCDIRTADGWSGDINFEEKLKVTQDGRRFLVNGGVGPYRSIMPFYVANKGQVSSLLKANIDQIRDFDANPLRFANKNIINTHVYPLSEIVEGCGHSPDFLKIDIQGMDWAVVRSARDVLAKYTPYLLMETNNQNYYDGQPDFGENIRLAEEIGFQIIDLYPIYNKSPHGRVFTFADILYSHKNALKGDKSAVAKELVRAVAYGKDFLRNIQLALLDLGDNIVNSLMQEKTEIQRRVLTEQEDSHIV